jgi:superfamily II DNA or RNA helicase
LKTTLRNYQREAVQKAIQHDGFAFFPEQRTGKCLLSIAIADHVKPDIIFIVCPKKALRVWSKEFDKHLDVDWDCYIRYIHYEAAVRNAQDRRRYYRLADKWKKQSRSIMVIVDEIHRCKKRGTRNSRFIRTIGKRSTYRLGLTGTPIAQGHKDAWAIFDFIQPGALGDRWKDFENEYLEIEEKENWKTKTTYKVIIGPKNEEEFNEIFHYYSYRITLAEARRAEGLPGARIRHKKVLFDLKKTSWKPYNELKEYLETVVNGHKIDTPLVLTLSMKLQQIAGGFVIQDKRVPGQKRKKRQVHTVGAEKMTELGMLLINEEKLQNKKLVICCRFKHEIEEIGKRLSRIGLSWKIISGKHEYNGEFDVDVIILQIQSGEAIDLSLSNTYIYYSWNHSLINYEQARFRVQAFDTEQVNYWYLIAKGTVDEDMFEAVVKKKNLLTLICDRYRRAA